MSLQDRIDHHRREARRLRENGQGVCAEAHERLARKKAGERVNDPAGMENLPIKSDRLPAPHLLARWSREGLCEIDADAGVFRLTAKGRALRLGLTA